MPDARCPMPDMTAERPKSYNDLRIYQLAKDLAVKVHKMTLEELPKFETYETASQIRRSAKSIVSNIVEGFGRRRYKAEFVQFLTYAVASCDETKVHLELLCETKSLSEQSFKKLSADYDRLCAMLFQFRASVMKSHKTS